MSRDMEGSVSRPRALGRARVGWPSPLRELKDLLYRAYLEAGAPSLDEIAADIADADAEDRAVTGAPSRDTIRRCISEPTLPPNQADAVSVAVVLARRSAWDAEDLAARVRRLWVEAQMAIPVGRPVGEFDDRLVLEDLEVHAALGAGDADAGFSALPTYVPRELDAKLGLVVSEAVAGQGGIAVLVGGSSTGKTRACWEAVKQLPRGWRLWHPIDPTHADAALAGLDNVAPRTVVWLNEAQLYLTQPNLGEQVAAGLRNLLREPERGPILVLATLWPDYWDALTTRTGSDPHAHSRQLLTGHKIDVPDVFSTVDLATLADVAGTDSWLREAAEQAPDRQITQYLAGVPVLMDRYHGSRGITKALIHAAMDARRLGAGPRIPLAWLTKAAPGYLTETEWQTTSEEQRAQALTYVTESCNGIPGILTPVKSGAPRNQRSRRSSADSALPGQTVQGPLYQLADYLDQHGRLHRADRIPPIDFWTAAVRAHPADLAELGDAAWNRGLYRDAAQLHKQATAHGDAYAGCVLVRRMRILHPTEHQSAQWASAHVTMGNNPVAIVELLRMLGEMGAQEHFTALAERVAAHFVLHDPFELKWLLKRLRKFGAVEQLAVLLARDPASHVTLAEPSALPDLLDELREAAAEEQVTALSARAAAHFPLARVFALDGLMRKLRDLGAEEHLAVLAKRTAAHVDPTNGAAVAWVLSALTEVAVEEEVATLSKRASSHILLDNGTDVAWMLNALREAGAEEQVAVLLARAPAAHILLDHPWSVARLLNALREAGADEQVAVLLARAPAAHVSLDYPSAVAGLLSELRSQGAGEQVAVLAERAAALVNLADPSAVAQLLNTLRDLGAGEHHTILAERAADHVNVADPSAVAQLLSALQKNEAEQQVAALAERAATLADLANPTAVAQLLSVLHDLGAEEHHTILAERAAGHVALDKRHLVGKLLSTLQDNGAEHAASVLAQRLPGAGCFDQFVEFSGQQEQFRWGREPDGSPADPWSWADLH